MTLKIQSEKLLEPSNVRSFVESGVRPEVDGSVGLKAGSWVPAEPEGCCPRRLALSVTAASNLSRRAQRQHYRGRDLHCHRWQRMREAAAAGPPRPAVEPHQPCSLPQRQMTLEHASLRYLRPGCAWGAGTWPVLTLLRRAQCWPAFGSASAGRAVVRSQRV